MTEFHEARRRLLAAAGAGLLLAGAEASFVKAEGTREAAKDEDEKETGAVEDLMREHGVIRRGVLVYRNMAAKLRAKPASLDPDLLRRTATLFRAFGEDYHERKLEEAHIFPAVKKAGGPAAAYVDVLVAQHARGRALTDYVLGVAVKGALPAGEAEALAQVLDGVELMYEHHAAREDTVVFPAWKDALSAHQLDEMGELFEQIEHEQFGRDGFEDAVAQMAKIEDVLGMADIAQFTPPLKG
jgi:hemerythrin-like domain-containing protein